MSRPRVALLTAGVSIMALNLAAPARAAEAAAPAAATAVTEVIVTAEKREEKLQETPVAVTAVGAQSLVQQNLVQLSDYYNLVPGLSYSGARLTNLSIRGITTGGQTNPTVAVTIDDVPFGSSSFAGEGPTPDLDPADLSRVEVLRGPQGTLYGAASLGGLIKYVTADPNTHAFSGRLEVTGDSIEGGGPGWSTRGSVNAPIISDRVALRASGFYRHDDGYANNVLAHVNNANTDKAYGGRVALFLRPLENVTVNLSFLTQHDDTVDSGAIDLKPDYSFVTKDLEHQGGPRLGTAFQDTKLYEARINAELDFADLTSVTGFGQSRDAQHLDLTNRFGFLLPIFGLPTNARTPLINAHRTDKFSQEVRLTSKGASKLEWMVGVFYTHEQTETDQILDITDANTGAKIDNFLTALVPSKYEEVAGFADFTYHFTEKFDVQVGGRVTHNKQTYAESDSGLLQGPPDNFVSHSDETAGTFLFTPRYRFNDDTMAYLRIASGYRPGGPNTNLPSIPKAFKSDSVVNYELGLKGSLLDKRLSYNAALYWIDWKDIQLNETDPVTQFAFFGNASKARSRGLELSGEFIPWTGMALGASATFTDAALAADLPTGPTATVFGRSGDQLPFTAKFSGTLSAEQTFDLPDGWTGDVGGNLIYVGKRLGDLAATPTLSRVALPAYTTFDLHAGVRHESGWAVNVFLRNASDERGYIYGARQSPTRATSNISVTPIKPRTVGVTVSREF